MSDLYFDEDDISEDYAEDDEHDRDSGYTSEGGFTTGKNHTYCAWGLPVFTFEHASLITVFIKYRAPS